MHQLGQRDAGGSGAGHFEKLAAVNHGFVSFIEWVEAILGWPEWSQLSTPMPHSRTAAISRPMCRQIDKKAGLKKIFVRQFL
jgi:hypothetical protein